MRAEPLILDMLWSQLRVLSLDEFAFPSTSMLEQASPHQRLLNPGLRTGPWQVRVLGDVPSVWSWRLSVHVPDDCSDALALFLCTAAMSDILGMV